MVRDYNAAHAGRLSSRVKGAGIAPKDISVVWEKRDKILVAINGVTKEDLGIGSRHSIPKLVKAEGLLVEEDEEGFRWLVPHSGGDPA
jgi:hypothetical protein